MGTQITGKFGSIVLGDVRFAPMAVLHRPIRQLRKRKLAGWCSRRTSARPLLSSARTPAIVSANGVLAAVHRIAGYETRRFAASQIAWLVRGGTLDGFRPGASASSGRLLAAACQSAIVANVRPLRARRSSGRRSTSGSPTFYKESRLMARVRRSTSTTKDVRLVGRSSIDLQATSAAANSTRTIRPAIGW